MLSTSTTSSRSRSARTDSASLSASVDLEVVEEIFERGRNATSFPQVFRPYTDVLQEHDISPTADSAYYNFLLKVGVIKAPTWGDKWSIWKATNSDTAKSPPRTSPTFSSRQPPPLTGSGFAESHSQSKSYTHSSSLSEVKSRVPFLASASSDLDEGFADESVRDEGRSETHMGRPSPRKEMTKRDRSGHRSLVGYTPDQSLERYGDDISDNMTTFNPPIRTSTPIFAQAPKYQTVTNLNHARPPAYSVSDVSRVLEDTTKELSALGIDVDTPKGKSAPSQSPPRSATWTDSIYNLYDAERRIMENKADEFYELGLMGRCWDMWSKTSEFYRVTYKNIPIARNNLLLRQTLERWSKTTRHQLTLPNTADKHREYHLKSMILRRWLGSVKARKLAVIESRWAEERRLKETRGVWARWRAKGEKKRTDRWKLDMAQRELQLLEKRQKGMLRNALMYWRVEARGQLASSDENLRLVGTVFDGWRRSTDRKRSLRTFFSGKESKTLAEVFTIWQRRAILSPRETEIVRVRESGLISRVWDDWRMSSWQYQQSSTFDERRLLLTALDKWKSAHIHVKVLERKAIIYDNTRTMDDAFRRWKLESWGRLLLHTRKRRLLKRACARWRAKSDQVHQLDSLADQFVVQSNLNRLQTGFSHWRSVASVHQTNHLRAQLVHEQNMKLTSIKKWCSSTETIKRNVGLADKAHAFFLLRTAFGAWRAEGARSKAERWVEERRRAELRSTFGKWRSQCAKNIDLRQRETVLRDYLGKRNVKGLLDRWTERVIEVKDRELRIAKARDDQLKGELLNKWHGRLLTIRANQKKANDSLEIRELENLRRVFRFWRHRAKREKRLRLTADMSLAEREGRLVRSVFESWYERKRERDLAEIEQEVSFLHENVILYGVIDRWKAATEILPGITADSTRLKRRALSVWTDALRRKQLSSSMRKEKDLKLLSEAFGLWRDAATQKIALNARRVRNRSRPSAGGAGTGNLSDRRASLALPLGRNRTSSSPLHGQAQGQAQSQAGTRRITPTSNTFQHPLPSSFPLKVNRPSNPRYVSRLSSDDRLSLDDDDNDACNGVGVGGIGGLSVRRSETVHSEPVYSRLRSELGVASASGYMPQVGQGQRKRGGSEEPEGYRTDLVAAGIGPRATAGAAAAAHEEKYGDGPRPRSGSEMLRALRGSMPGR